MTEQVPPPSAPRKRTNPLLLVLMALVPAMAIYWAVRQIQVEQPKQQSLQLNSDLVYNMLGLQSAAPLRLAAQFTDADGDLVADPPADAKLMLDPPTLMFSYVATNEAEGYRERFKEFVKYLSEKVGRPVEYALFRTPEEELKALQDRRLHVAGVNTGNIPLAVNECGFVPVCMLASEQGVNAYQMQIIVPADSPIRELKDLKGRELTLTEPGSNSGFKAPLVLLSIDNQLRPGRDFSVRYSNGHVESITGIADKTYQAAAVAGDVLQRAMAEDPPRITQGQFRVIYKSENFPTAAFGYVNNLKPELAAKVKDAFFSFQWKGTGVEREFAASAQTKFVPVSFKNDFSLVRRIDDAIRSVRNFDAVGIEDATQPATEPASAPATAP